MNVREIITPLLEQVVALGDYNSVRFHFVDNQLTTVIDKQPVTLPIPQSQEMSFLEGVANICLEGSDRDRWWIEDATNVDYNVFGGGRTVLSVGGKDTVWMAKGIRSKRDGIEINLEYRASLVGLHG